MADYRELIEALLANPDKLKTKKPFTRGAERGNGTHVRMEGKPVGLTESLEVSAPEFRRYIVPQEVFLRELDEQCHDVLFDENIPSLCVKINDKDYRDIHFTRMAIPFQRNIKNKQLLHLTGNPMQFTMMETNPSETMQKNFTVFKQYWDIRNQDGMKNKMVDTQLSVGDAGLLYYFDYKGRVKSRILSFADGYVLCPHNDQNGDRILESVYYVKDDVEYIDSYDDTYMTRWTRNLEYDVDETVWVRHEAIEHGFKEIPLITKRGKVAWDGVQNIIESYEILYNVFNAIQRRFGWGLLYVKGKFKQNAEKINGAVVLNDSSIEGKGDAKFLTPPNPEGTIETLQLMLDSIQLGASTTFILPKDLKTGGELAGITVQLVQNQDIQNALQKVIDWQNVADKMTRLFKYGLSVELVNSGENEKAITEFEELDIAACFKVWRPMNDYEYNQMITILTGAGVLSKESGIELNTLAKPDEKQRVAKETEEAERKALEAMQKASINNVEESSNQTKEEERQTSKIVKEENK
jgi:hypothetical protein